MAARAETIGAANVTLSTEAAATLDLAGTGRRTI